MHSGDGGHLSTMSDSRASNDIGFGGELDHESQRRELELELVRIRSEANAARLEARAAELELRLRRLARAKTVESTDHSSVDDSQRVDESHRVVSQPAVNAAVGSQPNPIFNSWDDVRAAVRSVPTFLPVTTEPDDSAKSTNRIDGASPTPRRPHFLAESVEDEIQQESPYEESEPSESFAPVVIDPEIDDLAPKVDWDDEAVGKGIDSLEEVDGEQDRKRKSPAALLVSTLAHVLVLVLLAAFTLSVSDPKDQVALSASVSDPSEKVMETFEFETSEPQSEPTEPNSDTSYEISPVGDMAVTEIKPDAPPAPPSPESNELLNSQSSAASMSLKSDSSSKIQFCGVEGGGNHFVYLVDSSGSMGSGFESARTELLNSISVLKPEQRFYVIFFDAEPDYMRLSDPSVDEPRSVSATPANKQALRRWAMTITKNKGRAPYDPLKFSIKLAPDVIFLLSDGEFPQGIEDLLQENNRVENLFGDSGPVSIVHTIGYFSREGETRMKRIAEQNGGQYRHVPKPGG